MRIRERDYPSTTCYKMSEEEQRRHGMNGSGDAPFEDAPQKPLPSPGSGGRLKFFKDGKLLLELAQSSDGERSGWVSVPRKTFWPPSQPSINTSSLPSGPERPPSLSVSDDNTSTASSPSQRENNWKKTTPRKNISKQLELYYVHRSIFNHGRKLLTKKIRRKPFHFIHKNQYVNGNIAVNGYIRVHDYSSRSSSESLYSISKFSKIHKKTSLSEVLKRLRRKIMDSFNRRDPPRPVFRPFETEAGPSGRVYTPEEMEAVAALVRIDSSNAGGSQQAAALTRELTALSIRNSPAHAAPHPPLLRALPPIPPVMELAEPMAAIPRFNQAWYVTEEGRRRWRELEELQRAQSTGSRPMNGLQYHLARPAIQVRLLADMQAAVADRNQQNQSSLRNVRQNPLSRPGYMIGPRMIAPGDQHRHPFLDVIEPPRTPNLMARFNVPVHNVENERPPWPVPSLPSSSGAPIRDRGPRSPGVASGRIAKPSARGASATRGSRRGSRRGSHNLTNRSTPTRPIPSGLPPPEFSQSAVSPIPQPGPSRAMLPPPAHSNQHRGFPRFPLWFHPNYTGPYRQRTTYLRHPRDWPQPNANQQQPNNDMPINYVTHERQSVTRINALLELLSSTISSMTRRRRQSPMMMEDDIQNERGSITFSWDYSPE